MGAAFGCYTSAQREELKNLENRKKALGSAPSIAASTVAEEEEKVLEALNRFNLDDRLYRVERFFENLFQEDQMMQNLLVRMGSTLYDTLRQGKVEQQEALAMFKARLQTNWWRSGKDVKLGEMSRDLKDTMHKLLAATHQKAASLGRCSPGAQHPLLLQVDSFFQKWPPAQELLDEESQQEYVSQSVPADERREALRFLSMYFDFVHNVSRAAKGTAVGLRKIVAELHSGSFSQKQISDLKNKIGCTHMALRMSSFQDKPSDDDEDSDDEAQSSTLRPAFVGVESIGKSTLVNFLVDPSGKEILPTGTEQVTQGVTVVRHGEVEEVRIDQELAPGNMEADLTEAIKKQAQKLKIRKQKQLQSLDAPTTLVIAPFKNQTAQLMRPEYLDVPGIRDTTQLDVALAFGVCTCIVICVNNPHLMSDACKDGEMAALVRLYAGLSTKPPILIAITKPRDGDRAQLQADPDTFELTGSGTDFVLTFGKTIDEYFPGCPAHKVLLADTHSLRNDPARSDKFVTKFHEVLAGLTVKHGSSLDPVAQFAQSSLRQDVAMFAKQVEMGLFKHSVDFDTKFQKARKEVTMQLETFQHHEDAKRDWKMDQLLLTTPLQGFKETAKKLPVFKAIADQNVVEEQTCEIKLLEDCLMQTRLVLMKAMKVMGTKIFDQMWQSFSLFAALYIDDKTLKNFTTAEASGKKAVENCRQKERSSLAKILADCVSFSVAPKEGEEAGAPEPVNLSEKKLSELEAEYKKWFKLTAAQLHGFASPNAFPWFLTGYYAAVSDSHLKRAFLDKQKVYKRAGKWYGNAKKDKELEALDISKFPNCWRQLKTFKDTHVQDWVARLNTFNEAPPAEHTSQAQQGSQQSKVRLPEHNDRSQEASAQRTGQAKTNNADNELVLCCVEAAQAVVTALEKSNIFENDNPLITKLVDLAFAMTQRMIVAFHVEDEGRATYRFTRFAEFIQQKCENDNLQNMYYYQESLGTAKLTSPKGVEELVRNMAKAASIMNKESEAGQHGMQNEKAQHKDEFGQGEMDEILIKARAAVNDLEAAKCGALRNFDSKTADVLVGAFGDVDLAEVLDCCEKVFGYKPMSAKAQNSREWTVLAQAMNQYKPAVCLFVRRCEAMSAEPDDAEKEFLEAIRTQMHFVGAMFWMVEGSFKSEIWSKRAGVSICKKLKIVANMAERPYKIACAEADLEDVTQGTQIFADADKSADQRLNQAKEKLHHKKRDLLLAINEYCILKERTASRGPEQFYDHVKDNRKQRNIPFEIPFECKLRVPHESMFHQEPFTESIAEQLDGEQITKVKERQIRHFLQSVLSSQVMAHGREIGEEVHKLVMGHVVSVLVADYFGVTPDTIPLYLEEYCSKEEDKSDRLDDHTPCEFLLRENFISMYVGGTVLACSPLMLGMINPPLRLNDEVTDRHYSEGLTIAEGHYDTMGQVGMWDGP